MPSDHYNPLKILGQRRQVSMTPGGDHYHTTPNRTNIRSTRPSLTWPNEIPVEDRRGFGSDRTRTAHEVDGVLKKGRDRMQGAHRTAEQRRTANGGPDPDSSSDETYRSPRRVVPRSSADTNISESTVSIATDSSRLRETSSSRLQTLASRTSVTSPAVSDQLSLVGLNRKDWPVAAYLDSALNESGETLYHIRWKDTKVPVSMVATADDGHEFIKLVDGAEGRIARKDDPELLPSGDLVYRVVWEKTWEPESNLNDIEQARGQAADEKRRKERRKERRARLSGQNPSRSLDNDPPAQQDHHSLSNTPEIDVTIELDAADQLDPQRLKHFVTQWDVDHAPYIIGCIRAQVPTTFTSKAGNVRPSLITALERLSTLEVRKVTFRPKFSRHLYDATKVEGALTFLAHASGEVRQNPCKRCLDGCGPFSECITAEGFANGRCTSCSYGRARNDCDFYVRGTDPRSNNVKGPREAHQTRQTSRKRRLQADTDREASSSTSPRRADEEPIQSDEQNQSEEQNQESRPSSIEAPHADPPFMQDRSLTGKRQCCIRPTVEQRESGSNLDRTDSDDYVLVSAPASPRRNGTSSSPSGSAAMSGAIRSSPPLGLRSFAEFHATMATEEHLDEVMHEPLSIAHGDAGLGPDANMNTAATATSSPLRVQTAALSIHTQQPASQIPTSIPTCRRRRSMSAAAGPSTVPLPLADIDFIIYSNTIFAPCEATHDQISEIYAQCDGTNKRLLQDAYEFWQNGDEARRGVGFADFYRKEAEGVELLNEAIEICCEAPPWLKSTEVVIVLDDD